MAMFDATNTLLDVDLWQNFFDFPLSHSPVSSSFTNSSEQPQWNCSSSDDDINMTSLTNASMEDFPPTQTVDSGDHQCTDDFSLTPSSNDSTYEDMQVMNFNPGDFSPEVQTGIFVLPEKEQPSSYKASVHSCKRPRKAKEKKRKYHQPTNVNNKLPPCRICADASSGFHYGVNTCEACKRFFKRALLRKRSFQCQGNKNCVIKGKKNNACGYCRYATCLALGMSKTAIKTGRYTHEKRAQDIKEIERLVSHNPPLSISEAEVTEMVQHLVTIHANVITNAYVTQEVMEQKAKQKLEKFELKKEMFGFKDPLTPELYDEVFQHTGLDVDGRKKDMNSVAKAIDNFVYTYVRFAKGLPGFSNLSLNDQANLLKLAREEVWFLGAYRGFMADYDVFYACNNHVSHRVEITRILGKEYCDYLFKLSRYLQKLNLSFEEEVVLKVICLTFGDRCALDDRAKVEEIQWKMLRCFIYMLNKDHPEDRNLFYKVMNFMVSARNITELSRKALSHRHINDAIRSNATLFDLIIF